MTVVGEVDISRVKENDDEDEDNKLGEEEKRTK